MSRIVVVAGAARGVGKTSDVDGLYIGGGYPEAHARALADNVTLRKAVRRFSEAGRPTVHVHFASNPALARAFVDACASAAA